MLRAFAITVSNGGHMQTLHPNSFCFAKLVRVNKNEATWYEALRHFDVRFVSALRVVGERWHRRRFIQFSDSDGNFYVLYLNWDDARWVRNYNWLDNDWNQHNPSASLATFFIFSSPLFRRGSFVLEADCASRRVVAPPRRVARTKRHTSLCLYNSIPTPCGVSPVQYRA